MCWRNATATLLVATKSQRSQRRLVRLPSRCRRCPSTTSRTLGHMISLKKPTDAIPSHPESTHEERITRFSAIVNSMPRCCISFIAFMPTVFEIIKYVERCRCLALCQLVQVLCRAQTWRTGKTEDFEMVKSSGHLALIRRAPQTYLFNLCLEPSTVERPQHGVLVSSL